jgi:hypothetical protein
MMLIISGRGLLFLSLFSASIFPAGYRGGNIPMDNYFVLCGGGGGGKWISASIFPGDFVSFQQSAVAFIATCIWINCYMHGLCSIIDMLFINCEWNQDPIADACMLG